MVYVIEIETVGQGVGVSGKQVWRIKSGDLFWMWLCLKYLSDTQLETLSIHTHTRAHILARSLREVELEINVQRLSTYRWCLGPWDQVKAPEE